MLKKDLLIKLEELGVAENMTKALCDWMDSSELSEFVEFLEDEL